MVFVGLRRARQPLHFNSANDVGHLSLVEDCWPVRDEIARQLVELDHGWPEIGLEFRVAGEHDQRDEIVSGQCEQGLHGLDVAVILTNGILEFTFLFEDDLCPVALIWTTVNPALVVFGFDDEDASFSNQDMVNLCCAVFGFQRDVVEQNVEAVEARGDDIGNERFAHGFVNEKVATDDDSQDEADEKYEQRNQCGVEKRNHVGVRLCGCAVRCRGVATADRAWPVTCNQCRMSDCHHGLRTNCSGRSKATQGSRVPSLGSSRRMMGNINAPAATVPKTYAAASLGSGYGSVVVPAGPFLQSAELFGDL